MIDKSERIANFLYQYRKLYYAAWPVAFVVLGVFALLDYKVNFAFVLTFLWLIGIGALVKGLRRNARIEEAKKMRDTAFGPEIIFKFITSTGYDYFILIFSVFWFSFLAYVTVRLVVS